MSAESNPAEAPAKHWSTDTYAVRERFGLGLMLLGMAYLAMVLVSLRVLGAPTEISVFFTLLLVWVAIAQAAFGKRCMPRVVSQLAGAAYMFVASPWVILYADLRPPLSDLPALMIAGAVCGYFAGAVIASLFLTYDYLAMAFGSKRREREALERAMGQAPRESPWDE